MSNGPTKQRRFQVYEVNPETLHRVDYLIAGMVLPPDHELAKAWEELKQKLTETQKGRHQ